MSRLDYEYGNTARKLNRYDHFDREETEKVVPIHSLNRKTVQHSRKYVMMVVKVAIVISLFTMLYIFEQSSVTNLRKEKGQLTSEYESLKLSNDLYYEDINSKVDIKEIERIAVEDLGMKMAGSGQIYTYVDDVDDYVKQYMDVPN